MVSTTAEQRAQVNARLDELLEDIRDLARRLDVVNAALPTVSALSGLAYWFPRTSSTGLRTILWSGQSL